MGLVLGQGESDWVHVRPWVGRSPSATRAEGREGPRAVSIHRVCRCSRRIVTAVLLLSSSLSLFIVVEMIGVIMMSVSVVVVFVVRRQCRCCHHCGDDRGDHQMSVLGSNHLRSVGRSHVASDIQDCLVRGGFCGVTHHCLGPKAKSEFTCGFSPPPGQPRQSRRPGVGRRSKLKEGMVIDFMPTPSSCHRRCVHEAQRGDGVEDWLRQYC